MSSSRIKAAGLAVAFAALTLGASVATTFAAGSPTPASGTAGHPVHIHSGACATLGAVVYPLTDLTAPSTSAASPAAVATTKTTPSGKNGTPTADAVVVASSTTKVKVALKDLEKTPFAINAHESMAKITNYIACGDIKGAIANGKLTIKLSELNKSGLEGDAVLTDNGDGTTTVVVELSQKMG